MADPSSDNEGNESSRAHDWELLSMSTVSISEPKSAANPAQESGGENKDAASDDESGAVCEATMHSKYFVCPSSSEDATDSTTTGEDKLFQPSETTNEDDSQMQWIKLEEQEGILGHQLEEVEDSNQSSTKTAAASEVVAKISLDQVKEDEHFADAVGLKRLQEEEEAPVAWWKRQSSVIVSQVRQANALWSIAFAAAAVMGLVILGQRWHHERCQNQQLRTQICSKDEKISQLMMQMSRMKEAISGRRRVSIIRPSSVYVDHF